MSTLQLEKQIEELKSIVEKRERLLITLQVTKTKCQSWSWKKKLEVGKSKKLELELEKSKLWQRSWGRSNGLFAFQLKSPLKISLWNSPVMLTYVNIISRADDVFSFHRRMWRLWRPPSRSSFSELPWWCTYKYIFHTRHMIFLLRDYLQ